MNDKKTTTERKTTITASEFVSEGYAAKIERGECVVRHPFNEYTIKTISLPYNNGGGAWIISYFGREAGGVLSGEYKFNVEWLTPPASPAPKTVAEGIPETFDIDAFQHAIINMDGDLMMGKKIGEYRVRDAEKAHDEIVADLQADLKAARDRERGLLAALETCTTSSIKKLWLGAQAWNIFQQHFKQFHDGKLWWGLSPEERKAWEAVGSEIPTIAIIKSDNTPDIAVSPLGRVKPVWVEAARVLAAESGKGE